MWSIDHTCTIGGTIPITPVEKEGDQGDHTLRVYPRAHMRTRTETGGAIASRGVRTRPRLVPLLCLAWVSRSGRVT